MTKSKLNINPTLSHSLIVKLLSQKSSRLTDKPISFEMSLGNAGNTLDGQLQNVVSQNEEGEGEGEEEDDMIN